MANTYSLDLEAGSSQSADRDDTASLSITGNMTVECWVKMESLPAASGIMAIVNKFISVDGKRSYHCGLENVSGTYKARFAISSDGTAGNTTAGQVTISISTGVWTHLAFVYTAAAGQLEVFQNGISAGTAGSLKTSIWDGTSDLELGCYQLTTHYFDGLMDDVRLWATTKTGADILASYKKELVGNETNLNAYWKLNNNYLDATANANHLTDIRNAPVFSTDVPSWPAVGGAFADYLEV